MFAHTLSSIMLIIRFEVVVNMFWVSLDASWMSDVGKRLEAHNDSIQTCLRRSFVTCLSMLMNYSAKEDCRERARRSNLKLDYIRRRRRRRPSKCLMPMNCSYPGRVWPLSRANHFHLQLSQSEWTSSSPTRLIADFNCNILLCVSTYRAGLSLSTSLICLHFLSVRAARPRSHPRPRVLI